MTSRKMSSPTSYASFVVIYLSLLLIPTHFTESGLQPPLPSAESAISDLSDLRTGTVACASCPNDGFRDCIGRTILRDHCLTCATGRTWWPCNLVDECHCEDLSVAASAYPVLSSMGQLPSFMAEAQPQRQATGIIGSEACANCPESKCVATNSMSVGNEHCAQCAKGQTWWPCNLVDECYCTETVQNVSTPSASTSAPTVKSTEDRTDFPTTMGVTPPELAVSRPGGTSVAAAASTTATGPVAYTVNDNDDAEANRLEGMRVIDAHIAANKIALVRDLLSSPARRGRGGSTTEDDFTYLGLRSALHTAITLCSSLGNQPCLYVGEMFGDNGRAYGLVNIAAFLAMSASDSLYRGGCDEVNVDVVTGTDGVMYLPASNACGQGGMNYQDMKCQEEEAMYDCPVDPAVRMYAGPVSGNFIGGATSPRPFYCGPTEPGGVDEGVKGCCWWGRGSIRLRGTCNYGKLNYYLGKGAADEGRPSPYPDIDFCTYPQAVCSESERYPDLPWMAGLFRWTTEIQSYNRDGFDYIERLQNFVDGGLRDMSFMLSVSGIVAAGCHVPPCAGALEERAGVAFDRSGHVAMFERTLRLLGFPVKFYTSNA